MKKVKVLTELDKANKLKTGTQFAKAVKMRESTYNLLMEMKKNDKSLKSLDDVVVGLITIAAMASQDK